MCWVFLLLEALSQSSVIWHLLVFSAVVQNSSVAGEENKLRVFMCRFQYCTRVHLRYTTLRMNLNSSEYNQISAVAKCFTVINQLLAETYLQYLELEGVNEAAVAPSSTSGFNKIQDPLSKIRSMNDYSESCSSLQTQRIEMQPSLI